MAASRTRAGVSVIVLTKNEEAYVERCIQSARFADEIIVVDSGSDDRTCELAREAGAAVISQPWLGWSNQRNRGAEAATHDWIFVLEADEVISAQLERSLEAVLCGPLDPGDGYSVDRRGDFLGVLLPNESRRKKRSSLVRLYNRRHSRYDPDHLVHEEVSLPGRSIPLDGVLLHWRGQTLGEIAAVFNRYATIESEALARAGARAPQRTVLGRPILRFLWVFFWKGAFLRGPRGLIYAMLKAYSEFLRYATLWERQNVDRPLIHPPSRLTGRPDVDAVTRRPSTTIGRESGASRR